jgi:hypothetical protein
VAAPAASRPGRREGPATRSRPLRPVVPPGVELVLRLIPDGGGLLTRHQVAHCRVAAAVRIDPSAFAAVWRMSGSGHHVHVAVAATASAAQIRRFVISTEYQIVSYA